MSRQAYWAISKHYAPKPIKKDESTQFRLETIKNISTEIEFTSWEKEFLDSISDFYQKKGGLTPGQIKVLEKIEKKYSADEILKRATWDSSYKENKQLQQNFKVCCEYYLNHTCNYYCNITVQWKSNKDYIPTFEEYHKIADNKYSKRVIESTFSKPKYDVGSIVVARTKAPFKRWQTPDRLFLVIKNKELGVKNPVIGGKRYEILPFGEDSGTVETDERWIKKPSKKLLKELEEQNA